MASKKPATTARADVQPHDHPLPFHDHALPEHEHALLEHGHPVVEHQHLLEGHEHPHEHDRVSAHQHRDLRAELRGAVRAVLKVVEVGHLNSAQVQAIHDVRVIIGDAHGRNCSHEHVAYETGDVLVCQDCRQEVNPDAAG